MMADHSLPGYDEWLSRGAEPEGDLLSETERWQVEEARTALDGWDREHGPDIYGLDRTLADAIRGLLAIVDRLAPRDEG